MTSGLLPIKVELLRLMHCNKIRGDAHVLPRLFVLILNANINAALRLPFRNQIYCFDRPAVEQHALSSIAISENPQLRKPMMGIVQVGASQSHLDRSRPEIRGWFQRQPGWSLFSR